MEALGAFNARYLRTPLMVLLRVHDALLARLSNDDDMEKGLSTFAEEMSSSSMILGRNWVWVFPR